MTLYILENKNIRLDNKILYHNGEFYKAIEIEDGQIYFKDSTGSLKSKPFMYPQLIGDTPGDFIDMIELLSAIRYLSKQHAKNCEILPKYPSEKVN